MDLEKIRQDFNDGKMVSKCTWALVLEAAKEMEDGLHSLIEYGKDPGQEASDCLGRVAAL